MADTITRATAVEHLDVLIVGAGLSGIGAAVHLQQKTPDRTCAIRESRDALGGTWASYQLSKRKPHVMKALVRKDLERRLPAGYDIDTHFTPSPTSSSRRPDSTCSCSAGWRSSSTARRSSCRRRSATRG